MIRISNILQSTYFDELEYQMPNEEPEDITKILYEMNSINDIITSQKKFGEIKGMVTQSMKNLMNL